MAEETIEAPRRGARPYARTSFVLQALLTCTVVAWVLDLHRAAGLELYTEQFLVVVLGFAIALCFLSTGKRWWDPVAAFAGVAICFYVGWRYPTLVNELTERPLDGILISAALC
ncbi:MAG TPA: hypothetical protein VL180_07685, partial [Burkholderiales bacterium]|nr:hypothetical protein [Burkholderiales bacterium]